ncbi:hypothetical protein [Streptacidiphilus anmyonensis]|uniref:hypothetical protein n=1 Tax=Streptacidiphilus anmyonensis TaxID=405782 RepID=UPI0006937988|nr:hypothetical protein [Streptacidiphilus anmyonensis]
MRIARTAKIAAVAVAIPALMLATSSSASASDRGSSLRKGQTLYAGDYIWRLNNSGNAAVLLEMQPDGNLVEYVSIDSSPTDAGQACWATGTNGSGATHATYQSDGNFVLYTDSGRAVWASNTQGKSGNSVDINWRGIVYAGATAISSNNCQNWTS